MKQKKFRVYDDRNNETLFASDEKLKCAMFINSEFDENDDDFPHVWIEDNPDYKEVEVLV